ncbi:MAG: hypothetical protein ACTSVC_15875 [Promethearchaeota archaeon]
MKEKEDKVKRGSRTAKGGFLNEEIILKYFKEWKTNKYGKRFLKEICKYERIDFNLVKEINVNRVGGKGGKADLVLEIPLFNKRLGISLKKQEEQGYNHIDRRSAQFFAEKFKFSDIAKLGLYKYCGVEGYSPLELFESKKISEEEYSALKDTPLKGKTHREGKGHFYFYELTKDEQKALLDEFKNKQIQILNFILKGEGKFKADYLIITKHIGEDQYLFYLEPINKTIERAKGTVTPSKRGTIHMGKITIQRKGGTGGATQIQFKWKNIFPEK